MPESRSIHPPDHHYDRSLLARARRLRLLAHRASFPLLRVTLGIVFIWFGALKISDSTPVGDLVANTLPFIPREILVPALGGFEVLLGIGLLIGRWLGAVALLMMAHLTGTFLVLVMEPDISFQNGNPLLLTMTGEFVVKNIVLITAGLVLATLSRTRRVPNHNDALAAAPVLIGSAMPEPGLADAGYIE